MKKNDYIREYNKDTYKTVKVYIREEEYPTIIEHMKARGYTKISGYIKDLIAQDMERTGEKPAPKQSISIGDNHGAVMGDNNGTIHL